MDHAFKTTSPIVTCFIASSSFAFVIVGNAPSCGQIPSRSFPKGPSTCCHSGAWAINKSPARRSALLKLKGHKDFGAQPTCLEQKVIRRTRNPQAQSNLRVLRNSQRKEIRKEMTPKSKEESRRERSNNFQAFVKLALETLLGSCRRKHGGPRGKQG